MRRVPSGRDERARPSLPAHVRRNEETIMAHEIESFAYAGAAAWHGLGEKLDETRLGDVDYLKTHPALSWRVDALPLYLSDGREANTRAIVRDTDKRILGEVGSDYTPLQNADLIEWFRPFLASGSARAECLGSLREGSRVYMLARCEGRGEVVPGDAVEAFLLLANSHDASLRVQVGFTPVRVVCANTLRAAMSDKGSKLLRLRHTSGLDLALETVQQTINVASRRFEATIDQYKALARSPCTDETLDRYVRAVFEAPRARVKIEAERVRVASIDTDTQAEAEAEAEAEAFGARIMPRVRALFEGGEGTEIPGVRGTLWGAYNAVSEYVQHERGRSDDSRLNEALFGSIVQRATDQAVKFARAA